VSVAPVDCGAGTVGVTIDNTASTSSSSSEEFAITSTRYPEDGGAFHTSLAVPGGKSVTVEVPVGDLAGGGLRVVDTYPDDVVLYEAAVDTECPTVESSRPTPGSTPTAAPALAATGASGVLPLLLVGFGLLTSGALLILAASSRRV
jgi:hypothetical protein